MAGENGKNEVVEMFDVSSLVPAVDVMTVEIFNPVTKRQTGITIEVYSRDSDVFQRITDEQNNRRLRQIGRRIGGIKLTVEESKAESLEVLVACTRSWSNMAFEGKRLECTPDNARMIYTKVKEIREQVEEAMTDRSNFMKG